TFESPNGVRRKIPVTPVLSTGPKKSNQHHDTLHYRHGTLVFPSDIVVQPSAKAIDSSSLLTSVLNSPSQSPSEAVMSSAASSPPIIQFSHPAAIFNQFVVSLVDHSVLKLCQDGDAGALSRYLSLHHDKVSARNLNATDQTGKSGLLHAAMTGNVAIARLLIKLPGLEVNLADNEGNTALHLASQAGHADVVSLLTLCPNLSIDIRNNAGLTALMKAALQGRVRCTRLLLLAGASPVLRDFGRGLCSVEWARLTGRTKCAEIID
ncbi:MAGUK p55 subfamily member, partial [Daphnia magna]